MRAAKFYAKVFDSTGATFRRTLSENEILALPNIVREAGKPASDIDLVVALPWDGFGYGESDGLNLFDLIKLYAVNESSPTGTLVFAGHISEIEAVYEAGQNRIKLRVMPIDALLSASFFRDGASFSKAYAGADIDTIIGDAIAHANVVYGSFFTASLGNPGKAVTVTFDQRRHSEMINEAAGYLDENWFWRIEADGTLKLSPYNITADHTFTAGFDVDRMSVIRSVLDAKNGYRLAWGGSPTYAYYSDATSIAAYGRREEAESDGAIQNSGSADIKGNAYIAKNKDPKNKMVITVNVNYAIETIKPGDTCRILNSKTGALPSGLRRIVRVEYDGTEARLHLDDVTDNLGREFGKAI